MTCICQTCHAPFEAVGRWTSRTECEKCRHKVVAIASPGRLEILAPCVISATELEQVRDE